MDPRLPIPQEDLYTLQMEVKQVQYTQSNHAERLLRLEKRQADDAALKSVWNSPFPGVLSGTPQQDPIALPHNEIFDDLDEQGEQLLGSLHLGPAEEEPSRRGAASRANSVRFDESALHGSSWGGQNNRHSGDFGPMRPGSSLLMERSSSHKSDGRHSSAGHSVHSHHSGRASSLGLDTNFAIGDDDDDDNSPFEVPGIPASFYVLGTVPSIVRCWLTPNYAHKTLLYADICTGSQRSTVDFSLLRDLGLADDVQRDVDGICWARLTVYFAEAVVTQGGSRSTSPERTVPNIAVMFEVLGVDNPAPGPDRNTIRIFIGSDALRAHSADILFSRNMMVLYGDDRDRLRVPFVRPEDDSVFRYIYTANMAAEKPKLNANAAPFVLADAIRDPGGAPRAGSPHVRYEQQTLPREERPTETAPPSDARHAEVNVGPERATSRGRSDHDAEDAVQADRTSSEGPSARRRESSTGIWSSWRQAPGSNADGTGKDGGSLSGYQPAARGGSRTMKVLKPQKTVSLSARGNQSSDPGVSGRASNTLGETTRRKSQTGTGFDGHQGNTHATPPGASRWDTKRAVSGGNDTKTPNGGKDGKNGPALPRSANPVGVASAFSWMTPPPTKS